MNFPDRRFFATPSDLTTAETNLQSAIDAVLAQLAALTTGGGSNLINAQAWSGEITWNLLLRLLQFLFLDLLPLDLLPLDCFGPVAFVLLLSVAFGPLELSPFRPVALDLLPLDLMPFDLLPSDLLPSDLSSDLAFGAR